MKKYLLLVLSLVLATLSKAQLSGTYSINSNASQNPDFTSLSAAASALTDQGVSGPVLFEIAPGTFEEYVTLTIINGASETNRITFRGMGADNQQVVLTGNAGYTDNAMLTLNGTDYVTFENMTITSTSTVNAVLIKLLNGNVGDHFNNLRLQGAVSNTSLDNGKDLVYRASGEWIDLNNEFVNCDFINGYIGLYYQGHNIYTLNDGLLVENCTFTDQAFKGIYVTFTDHAIIRGNTVTNHNHDVLTNYHAMDLMRIRYQCIIENNVMNVTRNSNYATVFETRPAMGTEDEPIIIRNNTINLNSYTNSSYCIDLDDSNSSYVYFVHNTVRCVGPNACGNIFVEKSWPSLFFYNNLLVNETGGYVFRFQSNTDNRYSDYNRIQYNGEFVARVGTTDYATLNDWTAATGFDSHSALCTPQFVGDNDLHITSINGITVAHPLDYVTTDIDNEPRSSTPCAGADEYVEGVNLPPVVANPIGDVVFEVYPDSQTIDLSNTFTDPDDPDEDITIEISANSNPDLVSAVLNNRVLTLQRLAAAGGNCTITLTATSNGQSVETSFSVSCVAEDLPPVVANPLDPIHFTEFPQSLNFNLTNTFDDPDNNNALIEISVLSCPSEVTAMYNSFVLTVIRNAPAAFTNKTMVIRATSNGKQVDMEVLVSGDEVVIGLGIADFEDVTLGPNGYWQGTEGENEMYSGGWHFTNYYSSYFWGGFTASNHTDLTQSGLNAQYTAALGAGYDGSTQYAVAYTYGSQTDVYAADGSTQTVTGCYVTNNLWAYQNMLYGDATATPFGGTSGNDPDWFKLTATGKNASGQTIGTLDFYLADYRFSNNDEDYVLNTWEWFDLSPLGAVATISFSLSSSKNDSYGMITPAYFCMDDFNGVGPATPDLPPYIANPVEDVVFNLFPQSIDVDLNGVASDPDDDDEAIVYSLISNSNEAALSATLTGKTLTLNRQVNEDTVADLTLRAFSDGQYVEFNIHVVMNHYVGVNETQVIFKVFPNPTNGAIRLSVSNGAAFEYCVHNLLGQQVLSGQSRGETLLLDLSSYQKGLYFVSITQEGNAHIEKIIIK